MPLEGSDDKSNAIIGIFWILFMTPWLSAKRQIGKWQFVKKPTVALHGRVGNCNVDFWTFTIAKFGTSNFRICMNETKILESSFESIESKTESQQSTLQLHESLVLYHWNFMKCHLFHEIS
jgi:hypothetical protein